MAGSLTRLSRWLWGGGKDKEPASNGSSLNSSRKRGEERRGEEKGEWHSREERRIDKEFDAVLVPSDGVCYWTIGWMEPPASDFQSDVEADDSFAVLVPCYKQDSKELGGPNVQFLSAIENLQNQYAVGGYADGNKFVEQLLSSRQHS